MILRIKDFQQAIPEIRDHAHLFGDRHGDAYIQLAYVSNDGLDRDKKQFRFIASDDSVDLHEEIVAAGAFHELRHVFMANPVMLTGHQHRLATGKSPVAARVLDLHTEKNPVHGLGQFVETEVGRDHAEAVLSGAQRAVSVGFISRETRLNEGRIVHTKAMLLEISLVAVGANPNALVLNFVQGQLSERTPDCSRAPHQSEEWANMLRELRADLDGLIARVAERESVEARQLAALARDLRGAPLAE